LQRSSAWPFSPMSNEEAMVEDSENSEGVPLNPVRDLVYGPGLLSPSQRLFLAKFAKFAFGMSVGLVMVFFFIDGAKSLHNSTMAWQNKEGQYRLQV